MAIGFRQHDPDSDGTLEVEEVHPNFVEVYFIPPERSLVEARLDPAQANSYRTKLLEINGQHKLLTIYPLSTFGDRSDFLKPKYGQIERITLDDTDIISGVGWDATSTPEDVRDVLENLPPTFTKDYAYGLGLAKPYRFIIDAVEALSDCSEIVITDKHATGPTQDGDGIFYISTQDFEQARVELNKIDRHAQSAVRAVKWTAAHNILAERLGVPKQDPKTGRHPYRKLFTAVAEGKEELSEEDQNAVIGALTSHAADIAEDQPEKLAKLRGDIELVTLEALITRYEGMLGGNLVEGRWQDFFNENPFILNMAFGYPVIKVRDQASVGGRKLSGDGEKITDFLVKNSLTNNTAIFEIKTPQTSILNKTPFRDGVYTPSADLSGSINQALDQRYQFQKQIAQIKDNTRLYDIESYAVHCYLVIGKTPDGDNRKKSFELFRRNSKDVEIVTFDELLEKLKQLSAFLRAAEAEI
ncbi:Shedu immune nuclease family protein [Serpentinimonas barnesii]|uniref:Shedu immune nuclease family protein n=1 Tax=Serpentinimonas barnesii TaxID=1458427 RepID=UPI000497A524|nr:Shedu immune nuclease family protein [Serpentinimonas barnesii]